jgi:hypothetical protein
MQIERFILESLNFQNPPSNHIGALKVMVKYIDCFAIMCEVLGYYVSDASNAKSVKYGHLGPPRCLSSLPKHLVTYASLHSEQHVSQLLSFTNSLCIAIPCDYAAKSEVFGFRVSGKVRSRESAKV